MSDPSAYPLQWPRGVARTRARVCARFTNDRQAVSVAIALGRLTEQIKAITRAGHPWRHKGLVVSSNVATRRDGLPFSNSCGPADPGVCVYFHLDGKPHAMPCDKWNRVADNIVAIAKHVEAMRGMERWGVADLAQMFTAFQSLPPASGEAVMGDPAWWSVLGLSPEATLIEIDTAYRRLARERHPDTGGDHEMFLQLQRAVEAARSQFKVTAGA